MTQTHSQLTGSPRPLFAPNDRTQTGHAPAASQTDALTAAAFRTTVPQTAPSQAAASQTAASQPAAPQAVLSQADTLIAAPQITTPQTAPSQPAAPTAAPSQITAPQAAPSQPAAPQDNSSRAAGLPYTGIRTAAGCSTPVQNTASQAPSDLSEYLSAYRVILYNMIRNMTSAELTESISHNFIVRMIPHCRAAVEMCRNLLRFRYDPRLRAIAEQIIEEQTGETARLERILPDCSSADSTPRQLCLYQVRLNPVMETMFSQMTYAEPAGNLNLSFIREMIPHHEGAILMCGNTLRSAVCPALVPVLQKIVVTQQQGIRQLRAYLKEEAEP